MEADSCRRSMEAREQRANGAIGVAVSREFLERIAAVPDSRLACGLRVGLNHAAGRRAVPPAIDPTADDMHQ